MFLVLSNAKLALQIHTLIKREEIQVALVVQRAGRQKKAAPSVNPVRLGLSAASKIQSAKIVKSVSIVKVKKKMPMVLLQMKVRIQRRAWTVQQVGRLKQAAPSVNPARLGCTPTKWVKTV